MRTEAKYIVLPILVLLALTAFSCQNQQKQEASELTNEALTSPLTTGISPQASSVELKTTVTPAEKVEAPLPVEAVPTSSPEIRPEVAPVATTALLTGPDRVKQIQQALVNAGFYTGAVDGLFGPQTKKAVTDFQQAKGLQVDGKVGPKTWVELEQYFTR